MFKQFVTEDFLDKNMVALRKPSGYPKDLTLTKGEPPDMGETAFIPSGVA